MRDKVTGELKQTFRPEFLNRIDAMIVFHSLTPRNRSAQIVDLELARVRTQLAEQDITLEVTEAAMDLLGERGYDHTYGARPLRRIIQNLIEDPLAEGLLDSRFQAGLRPSGSTSRTTCSSSEAGSPPRPRRWRRCPSESQSRDSVGDGTEGTADDAVPSCVVGGNARSRRAAASVASIRSIRRA